MVVQHMSYWTVLELSLGILLGILTGVATNRPAGLEESRAPPSLTVVEFTPADRRLTMHTIARYNVQSSA